jgi:Reversibly glycosylated polypeptide
VEVKTGDRRHLRDGRTAKVAVVIPIPSDPDWSIFEELSQDVPVIVVDDSDGMLSPAPRANVRFFDYSEQREVMGPAYDAIPHRSAATRNFGHVLAYREGFDVIVALDYDCRPGSGWLDHHLSCLGPATGVPAVAARWINTIETEGFWARGYPYEYRNAENRRVEERTATGRVKVNMGLWNHILDLNGIDKLQAEPPYDQGVREPGNHVALGNLPVCGMNTAFEADVTPAYFFLPNVWVNGTWQLSRHDDIWGGYILKKLMDRRGDLMSFGLPVVEHTKQTALERVVVLEQWMHLMSCDFYSLVDSAVEQVRPADYLQMFGDFTERYRAEATRRSLPLHYRDVFVQLGGWMARWVRCFA